MNFFHSQSFIVLLKGQHVIRLCNYFTSYAERNGEVFKTLQSARNCEPQYSEILV